MHKGTFGITISASNQGRMSKCREPYLQVMKHLSSMLTAFSVHSVTLSSGNLREDQLHPRHDSWICSKLWIILRKYWSNTQKSLRLVMETYHLKTTWKLCSSGGYCAQPLTFDGMVFSSVLHLAILTPCSVDCCCWTM